MRVMKLAARIFGWLLTAVLALLLCANIYTIITRNFMGVTQPSIFGYSAAVVISGSMSPEIEVNDVVLIHREDAYEVGDIVTYQSGTALITHRIIEEADGAFVTKGDANNAPDIDRPSESDIVGKVTAVIPRVGIIIEFLHTPFGMTVLILCGMLMILLPSLPEIFGKRRVRGNRRFRK